MIKHLKKAEVLQILQAEPGGFFAPFVSAKAVIKHSGGVEVVPIKKHQSIVLGSNCTRLVIENESSGGATASSYYVTVSKFSKCNMKHD